MNIGVDSYYEDHQPPSHNHYAPPPEDSQWDSRSLKSYATHHSQDHLNPRYEMTAVDHTQPVPQLHNQAQPDYPPSAGYFDRGLPYSQRPTPSHYNSSGGWSAARERLMRRRVRAIFAAAVFRSVCSCLSSLAVRSAG